MMRLKGGRMQLRQDTAAFKGHHWCIHSHWLAVCNHFQWFAVCIHSHWLAVCIHFQWFPICIHFHWSAICIHFYWSYIVNNHFRPIPGGFFGSYCICRSTFRKIGTKPTLTKKVKMLCTDPVSTAFFYCWTQLFKFKCFDHRPLYCLDPKG